MTRHENEPVGDWHTRATSAYLEAATEVAAERGGHADGWEPPDPGVTEAFAEMHAAAKAVLDERNRPPKSG